MSEYDERSGDTPTFRVQVRKHGDVVHEERCESAEQALLVIEAWEDVDDTTFEVFDELASATDRSAEIEAPFERDLASDDDERSYEQPGS